MVRDLEQVRKMLKAGEQVVDLRPAGRFLGETPEPRAGVRGGHMPGSRNLPFTELVDSNGVLVSNQKFRTICRKKGLDLDKPMTVLCGSGISSCIMILALARMGCWSASVYDGSWTEWGARNDTPVVLGR